jgi:hypothetical protein
MKKSKITVEDIHKDFKTVAEAVIAEAKTASIEVEAPKKPEILERYEKLGLKRNKHLKEFKQAEDAFENSKKVFDQNQRVIKIIEYYRVLYPANSFIPHQNLLDLCKKYGLVFDKAEYFTEDIPLNCLEAMEKFEWKDADPPDDTPKSEFRNRGGQIVVTGATTGMDVNWHESFNRAVRQSIVDGNTGFIESGNTKYNVYALRNAIAQLTTPQKTKEFHIVGTKDMFDLPMGRSFDKKSFTSKVDDPIVLAEVKYGWIIVAAWGPEAELPEININKQ